MKIVFVNPVGAVGVAERAMLTFMKALIEPTFSRLFKTKNNIAEKRNQGTAKSNSVYA